MVFSIYKEVVWMYKIGDKVVHQLEGACFIVDLVKMEHNNIKKEYYILDPIRDKKSRLYIAKNHNSNRIRHAVSQQQMKEYEDIANSNAPSWIANAKIRNLTYSKTINAFDFLNVLILLKNLIAQKAIKKLCTNDSQLLVAAQRLIYSEISIVNNKDYDLVSEKMTDFYSL